MGRIGYSPSSPLFHYPPRLFFRLPKKQQFGSNSRQGIVPARGSAHGIALSTQVANMADATSPSPGSANSPFSGQPAAVQIELRRGAHPPVVYEIPADGFLIGSVPGCDRSG